MNIFPGFRHLTDETLLLLDEEELYGRAAGRAEAHRAQCPDCRARLETLRAGERLLRPCAASPRIPQQDAARRRLEAALLAAGAKAPDSRRWYAWTIPLTRPVVLFRAGMVAALLILAVTCRQATRPLQELMGDYEDTGPKPDHALTPGSAAALSVEQVCRLTDNDLDPKVPREKQEAVFRAYRLDDRAAKAYQVDFLINPQLGGDSSLKNLWPEPYHSTVWNATAKDALETRLHGMVCNGQIALASAQQELATDWIVAYKKYFHASRPVSTFAAVDAVKAR